MSHHTIRPGAGAGPRASHPVSMAESLQSNHTVVPVNKCLSALITDAEFGPPEEEDDSSFKLASEVQVVVSSLPQPIHTSSTSSPNVKKQRSMSLNLSSKSTKVVIPQITTSKLFPEPRRMPHRPARHRHSLVLLPVVSLHRPVPVYNLRVITFGAD